jgi:hypothetical protein
VVMTLTSCFWVEHRCNVRCALACSNGLGHSGQTRTESPAPRPKTCVDRGVGDRDDQPQLWVTTRSRTGDVAQRMQGTLSGTERTTRTHRPRNGATCLCGHRSWRYLVASGGTVAGGANLHIASFVRGDVDYSFECDHSTPKANEYGHTQFQMGAVLSPTTWVPTP